LNVSVIGREKSGETFEEGGFAGPRGAEEDGNAGGKFGRDVEPESGAQLLLDRKFQRRVGGCCDQYTLSG